MVTNKKEKSEVKVSETVADKIWKSIKDLKLEMFALPDQFVSLYYKPTDGVIESDKLYLVPLTHATSVFPALEMALGAKYVVVQANKFIVVSLA